MKARAPAPAATLALVAVTVLWGATFVVVKEAVREMPPLEFLAVRFGLASAVLAAAFPGTLRRLPRRTLAGGALAGVALAAGYATQTLGLQRIGATRAGFLTGLFVVLTPAAEAVLFRRRPSATELTGVGLAAAGLALLTAGPGLGLDLSGGDLLLLGTAAAFALHVVLLGRYAPGDDPRRLALVQVAVAAGLFAIATAAAERPVAPAGGSVWFALLLTGIGATAAAFAVQTWAQAHLSPTRTAVTLTMEPVFAGFFGFLLLGERLTGTGWAGAVLILAAMLLVAPRPAGAARPTAGQKNRRKKGPPPPSSW